MVVDDELISRKKLVSILSDKGAIVECEGGDQALEEYEKAWKENTPFELITLDIYMPDKSGLDVLPIIREIESKYRRPEQKKCVITMITSDREYSTIVGAIQNECNDYLSKPFEKDFVLSRFEEWMAD